MSTDYRTRAAARRRELQGGPLDQPPTWEPRSHTEAMAWHEELRRATYRLLDRPDPEPSTPEQRRRWPSGRIEDR